MLHLKSVHLVNFCQHRDLTVEFRPGVIGVLGGNGAGKSNLLKGVRFAVMKESGNTGVMADDLNWQAALDGKSGYVDLEFTRAGTDGRTKRFVGQSKASLSFGDRKARKSREVDEIMSEIVGVSKRILREVVFVDQGAIESILFEPPAERAKKFQGLFGTESAEVIRDLIKREVATLNILPVGDRISQIKERLEQSVYPVLKDLAGRREALAGALNGFDKSVYERVVAASVAARTLDGQIAKISTYMRRLDADLAGAQLGSSEIEKQVADLERDVEAARGESDQARARLGALEEARKAGVVRIRLVEEKRRKEDDLARSGPTPPGFDREMIDTGYRRIEHLRAQIAPKRSFVKAFKGGKEEARCPTCLQEVHNAATLAERFEREVAELQEQTDRAVRELDTARHALRAYERAIDEDRVRRETAKSRLVEIERNLSALGSVQYDSAETETLTERMKAFHEKERRLAALKTDLASKQQVIAAAQGQITSLRARLADLQKQVENRPTAAQCEEARKAIESYDDVQRQLAGVNGRLTQLQDEEATLCSELKQLEAEEAKLKPMRHYKTLCERARGVLHRDSLPQIVARVYLQALNGYLAEYLDMFAVPFTAKIKDDLSVVCNMPGIGEQAAGRLSGGQRVALGISFRFAVYRLFAGNLGFLVLDEPTVMLDTDSVQHVVDILTAIRRYAANTGMQIIVITHEPQLEPAFDMVIRL